MGIPFLKDIIYYLELISICEGVFVPLQDLIQLVYYLGRDLRSLTLNLQMWISSDSNRSNFILTSSVEEVHSYIHSLPILSSLTEKLIGLNVLENKNTNLWEVISFRDKISKRETFLFIDSTISNRRLFEIHPIFDSYLNFFPRIVVKKPGTPQLSSPNDSSSITNSQPSKSDLASIDNSSETRVFLEFNNLHQSQMTNVETNSIDSLLEQLEEMSKMSENFSAMNAQCKDSNNYSLLQIGSTLEVLSLQNMNSNLNKTEASSIQFSTEPKPDDWKKTLRSKSELQQILHRIVPTTISSVRNDYMFSLQQ